MSLVLLFISALLFAGADLAASVNTKQSVVVGLVLSVLTFIVTLISVSIFVMQGGVQDLFTALAAGGYLMLTLIHMVLHARNVGDTL